MVVVTEQLLVVRPPHVDSNQTAALLLVVRQHRLGCGPQCGVEPEVVGEQPGPLLLEHLKARPSVTTEGNQAHIGFIDVVQ